MIRIAYSGRSFPSAQKIADELRDMGQEVELVRGSGECDINWGRYRADSKLNSNIENTTNKRVMRDLFARNDVPSPRLARLHGYEAFLPLVGRPDTHSKGRGFWLCSTIADVEKALRGTRRKKAATHFMEYIEGAEHEYRVHIFKGMSIRMSEKSFFVDECGKKDYTTIKPDCSRELRRKLRDAAKKAVEAVGVDFGAVDIITKGDDVYVLEVNSAPGVGGSMPRLYAECFVDWLEEHDD